MTENLQILKEIIQHYFDTCTSVSLLHPDVTVWLGYTSLRVQERHKDAALGTQTSIIIMTLLHGISVILLSKPEKWKLDTNRSNNTNQNRLLIINTEVKMYQQHQQSLKCLCLTVSLHLLSQMLLWFPSLACFSSDIPAQSMGVSLAKTIQSSEPGTS